MTPPLEDAVEDIIGKAMRGLGLSDEVVAGRAGVTAGQVHAVRRGDFDAGTVLKIAPVLDLHGPSLVAIATRAWYPDVPSIAGLRPFRDESDSMCPNAFLAWDRTGYGIVFDTTSDARPIVEEADAVGLQIGAILITHTHHDHIAALPRLRAAYPEAVVIGSALEPIDGAMLVSEGHEVSFGDLHVEVRLTSGHSRGGLSYLVRGLERPVAVVGDALFAGSMGGGMVSWADALENNRRKLLTLPDETIVCPGHGPMTTVGQERLHNPCFREGKPAA